MNSHAPIVRPIALPDAGARRRRGRPGASEVAIAAFASSDTDALGRALGFPVAVLAVTDDPADHARLLSQTWHACWTTSDPGWFMPFDFGYSTARSARFRHVPFDARWMGPRSLPDGMRMAGGGLRVALPPGVCRADLGQAFGQAMADRRFDRVAQRPAEVRFRYATGRRLQVQARYAAAPTEGCDGRATLVDDLYAFRPRSLPSVVGAVLSSLRILTMCSALADAAVAPGTRHA